MSQEKHTAVDLLKKMGDTVLRIEQNLQQNRLDRKSFRRLLNEYLLRAESDGRLMNAARQEPHCDNRGVFLAYTHMELITWLSKNNYTLLSTSVGWYSWRQFLSKYRIPPFWDSEKAKDLKSQLHHIKRIAALVYADLQAYHRLLSNILVFPWESRLRRLQKHMKTSFIEVVWHKRL
ncbi:glyoxalase family protein [Penicillium macrosclerotiorum]|uniref:glyoxalase family protein n=1 Tax=Penicillium macrosclerotiorum TaxID=303699 RepID=UPI002546F67B|nr:glyoxalase family protein [Penicillium macrosclerotiorum]KAJ5683362.1 glyoxalase family protein [Penicillium macrosclerotiorum]